MAATGWQGEPDMAGRPASGGVAFLLAQLGAHAASRYAERVAALDLSPAQTGVLGQLIQAPGQSQQALSERMGVAPSTIVALIDGLEDRGLLQRRRSSVDRRTYELHLTAQGEDAVASLRALAAEHEQALTDGLSGPQRQQLGTLLRQVADRQGLVAGVHPGYRDLPSRQSGPVPG